MFHATLSTRRTFLRRSTLALAVLVPLGARLSQEARADKNVGNKPKTIAQKANDYIDSCFQGGSDPVVDSVKDGSTKVTCNNQDGSSVTCTFTNKSVNTCTGKEASFQHIGEQFGDAWEVDLVPGDVGTGEVTFTLTSTSERGSSRGRKR